MYCTFCTKKGHSYETCFKRTKKIPAWFIQLKEREGNKVNANLVDTQQAVLPVLRNPLDVANVDRGMQVDPVFFISSFSVLSSFSDVQFISAAKKRSGPQPLLG